MTPNRSQPNEPVTYLGQTDFRGKGKRFGIRAPDRRHHVYVVGKTGAGKTTLLRNLLVQDIEAGHGVGLIDPHGDLATELLDLVPRRRTEDVVYFHPADLEHPVGWNLLANVPPDRRHLVASSVVSAMKNLWRGSWGPRLEYFLHNAVMALLDFEGSTLLGIPRLFTDERYRARVVKKIRDPVVRSFFVDELPAYDRRLLSEALSPLQNKVGRLLSNAPMRNVLGQVRNRFDPRFIMDRRKIFIANLGKGELGEDKANFLGSLLVSAFQMAALGRADVPEGKRQDFSLVLDEFHNFTTEAFASALSEARKYRLSLVLAHQYVDQLDLSIRNAVFGNAGTMIAFRVGSADAELLAREFAPVFAARDMSSLGKYRIYLRLMIDGVASRPFSAIALPPFGRRHGRGDTIRRRSREKFSRPRHEVEYKIERWLGRDRA